MQIRRPAKRFIRIPTSYLLLLATPLWAAHRSGLRYAAGPSALIDVDTPDGAGPFPVILAVHGGGWSGGGRGDVQPFCRAMVASGFACAALDYRLAPATRFPGQIEDIRAAISFLMDHAGRFRLRREGAILAGESAGGQLVSWLGAQHPANTPALGVISFSAPADLVALGEPGRALGAVPPEIQDLLGVRSWTPDAIGLMQRASPIDAIRPGAPPFLIFHGQSDRLVPVEQSRRFCAALQRSGGSCELNPIAGARHGLWSEDAVQRWETLWRPVINNWMGRLLTKASK